MHADISLDIMCVPKLQVFIVLALENWCLLKGKLFEDFRYPPRYKGSSAKSFPYMYAHISCDINACLGIVPIFSNKVNYRSY